MSTRLANVSNPAAFGVEWAQDTSRYQLINPLGTTGLWLGLRVNEKWTTVDVATPARFGLTSAPKSFAEFKKVAEAFIAAGQDEQPAGK